MGALLVGNLFVGRALAAGDQADKKSLEVHIVSPLRVKIVLFWSPSSVIGCWISLGTTSRTVKSSVVIW